MKRRHRGRKPRVVTTSAGEVRLSRVYFECPACLDGGYVLDERLGVAGRYSQQVQRLMCLAAASWSYDVAAERLAELCGLKVSDTTIREWAQQHGAAANTWLREEPAGVRSFREATGDVEFSTDGTGVNTTEGWREMKLGLFSKRDRGAAAVPAEWDARALPPPKVRVAFAAVEDSQSFGQRWHAWRRRLGLADTSAVTVLADGAKWIWEEQRRHLPHAEGMLDIFHALEHVAATGQALHADPAAVALWTAAGRAALLHGGWRGITEQIARSVPEPTAPQQAAIDGLLDYLAPHQHHMHYAERLGQGRSIGSGQVEGACKNLIGRRLKQTGARWRVRRVNRMAGLCCLMYSHQWNTYWESI
jgi:hypothetical protein